MALIYTYPPIGNIEDADLLLVSDVSLASNATRNMDLGTFATYIIGSRSIITGEGTKDTIPVFTGDTSIGDSVMTAVTGGLRIAGGLSINTFLTVTGGVVMGDVLNVEGQTTLEDALSVDGDVYIDSGLTVNEDTTLSDVTTNSIVANGVASFNGASTFNADALFEEKAEFQGAVADSQGNVGTAGQVLSSTAGGVQWVTDEGGNVTGTGDNLTAAMWLGATSLNVSSIATSPLSFKVVGADPSNIYSLQFGTNAVASGDFNSVALGYGNLSSNKSTIATGFGTTASGLHAASFNFETIASGQKSAAFGSESVASGSSSFVVGLRNTAATSNAFAGGLDSTANPSLNGSSAFAYGNALNVTGEDAASFGKGNTVIGAYSFSAGFGNTISNAYSFALGRLNSVQTIQSSAIGTGNTVSGFQGHAIGVNNLVNAQNCIAVGSNLVTGSLNQVVVGKYNSATASAVFVVGNGSSGSEGNAIEVYSNNIRIPDYGSGDRTGDAAYNLQVDATGKIIETQAAGDYKELVALINQVGTQAPTTQLTLSNTLGVALPLSWTRISQGLYNLNAPGKFHLNKTIVFVNNGSQGTSSPNVAWEVVDADNLRIQTGADSRLTTAAIEIRTYI
jgi:hypothetical protein